MNSSKCSTILVVDDEEIIRYTLQKKLSKQGYNVIALEKAEDVLFILKEDEVQIDLIITEIRLRKMDGIELLRRINGLENPIPVLMITGHRNVEDAIRALRFGAIDYVRKPFDVDEIAASVRNILKSLSEQKLVKSFVKYSIYKKNIYKLPVDPEIINPLSVQLTKDLVLANICNKTTAENITMALRETISNSMFHGSLGVSSDIRDKEGIKGFNQEIEKRLEDPKFKDETVQISYELTSDYVEYIIDDNGDGFDHRSLPDPRDPENFFKNSGRGLLIIRVHMDEVSWNEKGNQIRLKKYKVDRNSIK